MNVLIKLKTEIDVKKARVVSQVCVGRDKLIIPRHVNPITDVGIVQHGNPHENPGLVMCKQISTIEIEIP